MRIGISFVAKSSVLSLPLNYNHIIQGFIYSHIGSSIASFLHEKGFEFEKRKFKLFTFSRLTGKYKIDQERIFFPERATLYVSSPIEKFITSLAVNLVRRNTFFIDGQEVFVSGIEVIKKPEIKDTVVIKMLSPITIYSTFETEDGRKKTYYYSPFERDFSELVRQNIIKKYIAFFENAPPDTSFTIEPLCVDHKKDNIILIYKGNIIKGWMGTYRLCGSLDLISFAYETGIGGKNSQGFGMFKIINFKNHK
ncbi:MAG: CRISPR-associated endoribonuclease Cas6 [Candidatus Calescibacterium sp.]|nr:CRISPR-associated endoribonuclease Cas6 [Candidatus Calescibacterium sp.]